MMNINSCIQYIRQYFRHEVAVSLLGVALFAVAPSLSAADPIIVAPLFEYIQAPDSIGSLTDRANYIVENFWSPMDFKNKQAVDQNALNDAFMVYATPMQWADLDVIDRSITKLLKQTGSNPVLALQFAKAAETAFYSVNAPFWSDSTYLKFIDSLLKNKKVKDDRKARYRRHARILNNTLVGQRPPEFDYTTAEGKIAHYHPNGVITVIEFGNPECTDCSMARLKLETDIAFSRLVEQGLVNVLFIIPDPDEGWEEKLAKYPSQWHSGVSEDVEDIYDIRQSPSIYVIDTAGHVAAKNITVEMAINMAKALADQRK